MGYFRNFFLWRKKEILFFFILIFFAVYITLDTSVSVAFIDGVKLWFYTLLPTLFPYAIITTLLSGLKTTDKVGLKLNPLSKKLFRINGRVFLPFFIGVISGHPSGVKTAIDLKNSNKFSPNECVRACILCSMSSPVFLISCIGKITFKSALFGVCLFVSNFLSAITLGLIFSRYKKDEPPTKIDRESLIKPINFTDGVSSSTLSVIYAGGFIVLFYMLTEILIDLKILTPVIKLFSYVFGDEMVAKGFVTGIIESTKGFKILSEANSLLALPLSAFITGLSGMSMICQSVAFMKSAKIKTAPFILSKIISAVLCTFYSLIFSLLFF